MYATANVQPSKENLKEIIECAGGKVRSSVYHHYLIITSSLPHTYAMCVHYY